MLCRDNGASRTPYKAGEVYGRARARRHTTKTSNLSARPQQVAISAAHTHQDRRASHLKRPPCAVPTYPICWELSLLYMLRFLPFDVWRVGFLPAALRVYTTDITSGGFVVYNFPTVSKAAENFLSSYMCLFLKLKILKEGSLRLYQNKS